MRQVGILAVAVLLLPGLCGAQSLGELAAKERERKKGQKTGKVFTEEDLNKAGQGGAANVQTSAPVAATSASPEAPAPAGAAAPNKPKTEDELRAEQEQAWREKLKQAQEERQRLIEAQGKIQANLNDLTGNIYGAQRTTLLTLLDKTKAELQATDQQIEALQEEGRRNRYRN